MKSKSGFSIVGLMIGVVAIASVGLLVNVLVERFYKDHHQIKNRQISVEIVNTVVQAINDAQSYCLKVVGANPEICLEPNDFCEIGLGAPAGGWQIGVWYFLAGTWDGSRTRIFLNGSEVSSHAFAGPLSYSNFPLLIGAKHQPPFARVWGRALAPSELNSIYLLERP